MSARISNIFPLLLITVFCIVGVEAFYLGVERFILEPTTTPAEVTEPGTVYVAEPEKEAETSERSVDYSTITRRNLFGPPPQAEGVNETSTVVDEELEQTTLDVVLMGTVGGGEENSRAIILNKQDRKQEIYQVGDSVQGAVIKDIRRGKVILSYNGRDEMLDMSEASDYGPRSVRPTAVSPRTLRRKVIPAPITGTSVTRPGQEVQTRVVRPTRRIVRPRTRANTSGENDGNQAPRLEMQEQQLPEKE